MGEEADEALKSMAKLILRKNQEMELQEFINSGMIFYLMSQD